MIFIIVTRFINLDWDACPKHGDNGGIIHPKNNGISSVWSAWSALVKKGEENLFFKEYDRNQLRIAMEVFLNWDIDLKINYHAKIFLGAYLYFWNMGQAMDKEMFTEKTFGISPSVTKRTTPLLNFCANLKGPIQTFLIVFNVSNLP